MFRTLLSGAMLTLLLSACTQTAALAPPPTSAVPLPVAHAPPPPPPAPQPPAGAGDSVLVQEGRASYYADHFEGRTTASGDTFTHAAPTAASPNLPLGSRVTVVNEETGKSVDVEVNDRGPFVKGRIIDVSQQAARELGMMESGTSRVRIIADPEEQPTPELREQVKRKAERRKRPRRVTADGN